MRRREEKTKENIKRRRAQRDNNNYITRTAWIGPTSNEKQEHRNTRYGIRSGHEAGTGARILREITCKPPKSDQSM